MATYGSTLDSLMANRLAEDALAGREQASYRDYLNAMANTNIRSREQEAMDRYRQGELGIRGQDVSGLNQFRTGQIGIGVTDAATRAAAANAQAAYQQGLVEAAKIAEQNRLNLETERNRLLGEQIKAGQKIPPLQEALVNQYGVAGAIQQAPGLFGIQQSENLRILQSQKEAEEETAYRNKLMTDYENALKQYRSDVGRIGWLDWVNPDDPSTESITKIIAANKGLTPEDAAMEYASRLAAPFFPRQAAMRLRSVGQAAPTTMTPPNRPPLLNPNQIQGMFPDAVNLSAGASRTDMGGDAIYNNYQQWSNPKPAAQ